MKVYNARFLFFLSLLLILGACAVNPQNYSISIDNNLLLNRYSSSQTMMVLGKPSNYSMTCGAFTITPFEGQKPDQYIVDAFNDELKAAKIYSSDASPITVYVKKMYNAGLMSRQWYTELELQSTNEISITVIDKYLFNRSAAEAGCTATASAFVPAVQGIIKASFSHPDFNKLLE